MEFVLFFGLMAIIFLAPIFIYSLVFSRIGLVLHNPKCSYRRSLLVNFVYILSFVGMHCLAVFARKTFSLYSNNPFSIYFVVELLLTVIAGAVLFKVLLSLKLIMAVLLSAGVSCTQLIVVSLLFPHSECRR